MSIKAKITVCWGQKNKRHEGQKIYEVKFKIIKPFLKTIQLVLCGITRCVSEGIEISISKDCSYSHIHCSSMHGSQDMETTEVPINR